VTALAKGQLSEKRFGEEHMQARDSKMRRFCNYFVTLFNQEKIIPFGQFINASLLNEVKQRVKIQMSYYAKNGIVSDLDPTDMLEGITNTEEEKESEYTNRKSDKLNQPTKPNQSVTSPNRPKINYKTMTENRSQVVDDPYSINITPKQAADAISQDLTIKQDYMGRSIHRDRSQMSVFFRDGSKSNLSSICHLENKSDVEIDKSDPGNNN